MNRVWIGVLLLLCLIATIAPARGSEPAGPEEAQRAYWQERARSLHAAVRDARSRVSAAEARYTRLRKKIRARGDKKVEAVSELEEARRELADAEARLEALPDEARRAGALPGWIRVEEPASPAR